MIKDKQEELVKIFEEALQRYKVTLDNLGDSTFYSGLVKETEEYINELKSNLNNDNKLVSNDKRES